MGWRAGHLLGRRPRSGCGFPRGGAGSLPSLSPVEGQQIVSDVTGVAATAGWVVGGLVAGVVVAWLLALLVRSLGHHSAVAADLARRSRAALRATLGTVGVVLGVRIGAEPAAWTGPVRHVLDLVLIGAVAWLAVSLAFVVEDAALQRVSIAGPDNRRARRVRTQIQLLRRLTVAVVAVCALAAMLLTFPAARTFGASLLASAGLVSIVAGLAAQSTLANLFAGVQLTFTDAIRVDDVVVVDGQWGRIEEITLTYVVVHIWDDRRLLLPSTYFATKPFENWTRRDADLLGTVELDLDWQVPVAEMRAEFSRLLDSTDLWDRRVGVLQVTDAVGGYVRVRALASAVDAPTLFDLRCFVREGLVDWLQAAAPQAIPRHRWEEVAEQPAGANEEAPQTAPAEGEAPAVEATEDGGPRPTERTGDAGAGRGGPIPARARPAAGGTAAPVPADAGGAPAGRGRGTVRAVPGRPHRRSATRTLPVLEPTGGSADTGSQDARLFTGSLAAVARSKAFSGPGRDVIEEREEAARRAAEADVAEDRTAGTDEQHDAAQTRPMPPATD